MNMRRHLAIDEINILLDGMTVNPDCVAVDVHIARDKARYSRLLSQMEFRHSPVTKEKIRAALINLPALIVQCPHCGTTNRLAAIFRCHFANCRSVSTGQLPHKYGVSNGQ